MVFIFINFMFNFFNDENDQAEIEINEKNIFEKII